MKPYLLLLLLVMVVGQSYAAGDCKAFDWKNEELFYEGECKDGYAHGIGLGQPVYEHNGSIIEGGKYYKGRWENGKANGYGTENYRHMLYEFNGEFKDGVWYGYGVLKIRHGDWIEGEYKKYAIYDAGYYVAEGLWNGSRFLRECSKIECDSSYDPYKDLDLKTKTDIVMNKITTAIKEEKYKDAVKYFPYLERINNNLPESFYFYQIQSLFKSMRSDDAKDKAKNYLKKYGSKGKYYAEVVEIMGR